MKARFLGWPTFWPGRADAAAAPPGTSTVPPSLPPALRSPAAPGHPSPCAPAPVSLLRGTEEARDALVVASLLRRPLTLTRAEALVERLAPYRPRLRLPATEGNPLEGLTGPAERRLGEVTLRHISPVLVDVVLPGARDYLLGRLISGHRPHPTADGSEDALPTAVEVAEAMRKVVVALNGAGRGIVVSAADTCAREARATADRMTRQTGPVVPRNIDELAHGLLRLEVLALVLDALGSSTGLDGTRYQTRRLARFAVRRAATALEGFARNRGLPALHASLSVLASVDGLIVIALRVLDSLQENREEPNAFVEPADRVAMGRYVQAAGQLADALLQMVGRAAVTPKLSDLFFEALIRQIAWLHRFCAHLGHEEKPEGLNQLRDRLAERTVQLAGFAGDAMIETILKRRADAAQVDTLLRRTEAIAELMLDMERTAELEDLALRILVVRETLATVAA